MCNIYIASTPFQYISALEAKHNFKSQTNIIIYFSHTKDELNFKNDGWDYILKFNFLNATSAQKVEAYAQTLKKCKQFKIDNLFLGDWHELISKISISYLKPSSTYIIDDGLGTIWSQELISTNIYFCYYGYSKRIKTYLRLIKKGIFFNPLHKIKPPNLFTSYKAIKPCIGQQIIYHDFEFLRQRFTNPNQKFLPDEYIYLIGAPMTRVLKNSEQGYLLIIQEILKKYNKNKIIYIPHRYETIDFLSKIQDLQLQIHAFNKPIEIALLEADCLPTHIIGFFSSALVHLSTLIPTLSIDSVDLRLFLKEQYIAELNFIYNYMYTNTIVKQINLYE
ncbi:hypothetical protein [Helicobacter rodentium]|uniref:hypothetical protein n=1 Tax=Helicobacter rodentium TaxID=59617 RepID=UPI00235609E0|nr:hypothetical protein [Helicobacter rodentium]